MELTRERIEMLTKPLVDPEVRLLAKQLLAEMDKPKAWDGAPEWADCVDVSWSIKNPQTHCDEWKILSKRYTRELPKTRERRIAEEKYQETYEMSEITHSSAEKEILINSYEQAILQARKEWEAER